MSRPEIERARTVCGHCPVRKLCLAGGLDEDWGIWGGYTRPERERALRSLGGAAEVLEAFDEGTLDAVARLDLGIPNQRTA